MKRLDQKLAKILVLIFFGLVIITPAYSYWNKIKPKNIESTSIVTGVVDSAQLGAISPADQKKVAEIPPVSSAVKQVTTTTKKNNQTVTTIVPAGVPAPDETPPAGGTFRFSDQTGRYASAEQPLRTYLSTLKRSTELNALYQITILDAGAIGWSGQYAASYSMNSSGKIVSAYGVIYLNASYYTSYSQSDFVLIMERVLSHEYGHHYTQYHKWVDLNLPVGVRFPDSYYAIRPLSKSATIVDCSTSWNTCESEIIAEDYSYLYSGFGTHQMNALYGFPSAGTKTWLDNIASVNNVVEETPTPQPGDTAPPTVSITSPANNAEISGTVNLSANASDDVGVAKVRLYLDAQLLAEPVSAPYAFSLNTTTFSNGAHTLKAVAYDTSGKTAESSVSVIIKNNPTVSITSPISPYTWTSATPSLGIQVRTGATVPVVNLKFYVNDVFVQEIAGANVNLTWNYASVPAGEYTFKAEAYDENGNTAFATLLIAKQ